MAFFVPDRSATSTARALRASKLGTVLLDFYFGIAAVATTEKHSDCCQANSVLAALFDRLFFTVIASFYF